MDHQNTNHNETEYQSRIPIAEVAELMNKVRFAIADTIVGQQDMVDLLLTALLAEGHVLLEGVPGVAKTLTAKTVARLIDAKFSRIQFTPDLMPSDVIGTNIFNPQTISFEFRQGPVFGNIVLIDEINRAPAKTQAALFEVMEERQITSDGVSYLMEAPFMVIATQNPIEHEGTYRLPEAQLDRFLFKINIGYPSVEEELTILSNHHQQKGHLALQQVKAIVSKASLDHCRSIVKQVHVEEKILQYITQLVVATRNHPALYLGASPRATIALLNAAKALAVLRGRDFVTPEDVTFNVVPALRHRVALTPEKEMEGIATDDVLKEIITKIEVPR
ncbi:magnesium chelatase [Taibaiella sp. KBW10]|uniref:AAA family ATPase n=1 Tax=Taibaiella sp. KBW10 TaxID=2153357 RepID=UPI000F5A78D0|nr:MoxR family ATPase [Taibaiella sp. KBW10]RQO29901.1 magnesium chelatase [Taibaiella sp. KBW10]